MKSKKIICGAVAAAITMSVAFSGCGLLTSVNEEDMKQTIATVNIGRSDKLGEDLQKYSSAIQDEVIVKRDLMNAFINTYSGNTSSGLNYETIFNSLVTQLTNSAIEVQYATLYVLQTKAKEKGSTETLEAYKAKTTLKDKLIYLLGGEDSKGVLQAQYNLYVSLNGALDSFEKTELKEDEDYVGTDTRSTPAGIDKTVDDYLPLRDDGKLDYGVYTGYDGYLIDAAGKYEGLDNTNRNTRRQAYSQFLKRLENNYLISKSETNKTDVLQLSYVQSQYEAQLQQCVVNEFYDIYNEEQETKIGMLDANGEYSFVKAKYQDLLDGQEQTNKNASAFETEMGNMSDTQFILYAPATTSDTEARDGTDGTTYGTFGYVYNVLLPFSVTQSNKLSKLQGYRDKDVIDESGYFAARNEILREIKTTDQRAAWFNGATDYSFDAAKYNEENENKIEYYDAGDASRSYLFFENNLTKTTEYKPLEKYAGKYTYNGTVTKNKDGSYTLVPRQLDIDDMLTEFKNYVNFVLGATDSVETFAGDTMESAMNGGNGSYYATTEFRVENADGTYDDNKIDYSKLVYATGRVKFNDCTAENMFVASSDRYKAMSAVNELQYAYTTDTGVLSQYIGYTVSAYETNYIKEFEYAAQQATRMGAGAFKVCAGDYGWHLIYVTDTFDFNGGEVYGNVEFTEALIKEEGTFQNKFYNWIKDSTLNNETTQKRTEILQYFANDTTVTKYVNAYKDLLELG